MEKWLMTLAFVFAVGMPLANASSASNSESSVLPLAKAHAHNDYEHTRPLMDALDHGFTSVEADIWLVDGELLVAHDKEDLTPERTLKSLYLDPLKERVQNNGGSVYPGSEQEFLLWIDIKSEGESTNRVLHEQLSHYNSMLTKFLPSGVNPDAVTVIVSGNRPRAMMENQTVRYASYDGRMSDLGSNVSNAFMPVISDNWTKHFTWRGQGEMPAAEREKLNRIVSTAHANGQIVRFWATPDAASAERRAIWHELLKAGVDIINTDDLPGLQQFLLANDPQPTEQRMSWEESKK